MLKCGFMAIGLTQHPISCDKHLMNLTKSIAIILGCMSLPSCSNVNKEEAQKQVVQPSLKSQQAENDSIEKSPKMSNIQNADTATSRFAFPSCAELKAKALSEDALITDFDSQYPAELVGDDTVEKFDLNPEELEQLIRYTACIASLSSGPDAPESALALFASKRYGSEAMKILKKHAQGSDDGAKAAQQFVEQMTSYLAGPSE
jgi:hypothetical protein